MHRQLSYRFQSLRYQLRRILIGPQSLAFLPALALAAFWLGGEAWLLGVALALPVLIGTLGGFTVQHQPVRPVDGVTGLPARDSLEAALNAAVSSSDAARRATGCFMLAIDDFDVITDRYGQSAADHILNRTAARLRATLRDADIACRIGSASFGVSLSPITHLDIETAIQMASRIQAAVEEPIILDNTVIYVSASIGFCLGSRAPAPSGEALMQATATALGEAVRNAPSAIRSYSDEMRRTERSRHIFADEAAAALENGQIRPHFQPQVSTDTGRDRKSVV